MGELREILDICPQPLYLSRSLTPNFFRRILPSAIQSNCYKPLLFFGSPPVAAGGASTGGVAHDGCSSVSVHSFCRATAHCFCHVASQGGETNTCGVAPVAAAAGGPWAAYGGCSSVSTYGGKTSRGFCSSPIFAATAATATTAAAVAAGGFWTAHGDCCFPICSV